MYEIRGLNLFCVCNKESETKVRKIKGVRKKSEKIEGSEFFAEKNKGSAKIAIW